MHWLIIIFGTFILSISLSNPFYKLLIGKRFKFNTYFQIIFRVALFIMSLIVIIFGLYMESL